MSFYVFLHYQLVEPLILPNTSNSLSAIRYKLSAISHQLQASLLADR
jgi:hypothetical protein